MWQALAGMAAQGFSSILNQVMQNENNYMNYQYQSQLDAQRNNYNTVMYERMRSDNRQDADLAYERLKEQNEYNNPTNQLARLRAAGINPNIAYSNGGLNNVGSSDISTAAAATASPSANSSFSSASSPRVDFQKALSDAANMDYQDKMGKSVGLDNQRKALENLILSSTLEDKIKGVRGEEDSRSLLGEYMRQQLVNLGHADDLQSQLLHFNEESNKLDLTLKGQQIDLNELQKTISQSKADYAKQKAAAEVAVMFKNIELMESQRILNKKQAREAVVRAAYIAEQKTGLKFENDFTYGDNPWWSDDHVNWKNVGKTITTGIKSFLNRK